MALRIRTETVTPEIAAAWLERSESNRNVVQSTVDKYARDMQAGRWLLTGEPIHFGESGRLLNGQHRLWAVVQADTAVELSVARGIENESDVMDVIDTPMKRTLAHALQIHGEGDTTLLAAIVNGCWQYEEHGMTKPVYPTHVEGIAYLQENPEIREAVRIARTTYSHTRATTSPVGIAYYLNAKIDPEASEDFWTRAARGEGLTSGDPILAWRRMVSSTLGKRDRPSPKTWLAYHLKAMNLWREGRKIRILSWKLEAEGMPDTWAGKRTLKKRRR